MVISSTNTEFAIKRVNKEIKMVATNYDTGIKEIRIVKPDGQQDVENYNNLAVVRKKYTLTAKGKYKVIITDKNWSQKEQEIIANVI